MSHVCGGANGVTGRVVAVERGGGVTRAIGGGGGTRLAARVSYAVNGLRGNSDRSTISSCTLSGTTRRQKTFRPWKQTRANLPSPAWGWVRFLACSLSYRTRGGVGGAPDSGFSQEGERGRGGAQEERRGAQWAPFSVSNGRYSFQGVILLGHKMPVVPRAVSLQRGF